MSEHPVEKLLERGIFASRWLLAPFYFGLVASLVILLIAFFNELIAALPAAMSMHASDAILIVLSLIDLSLAANLLLMVIFAGYENFVSRIDVAGHRDRPSWMGKVDFSGLKLKLIASIVAISGIHLLKAFMNVSKYSDHDLMWLVVLHLTFVASGVLLALMDWLTAKSGQH